MSTELKSIRKKRTASEATAPAQAPDGDHRKRRRNRTTQSCLNCHTSKRMKASMWALYTARPCLCVYEVDDPSQRTEVQDESSRLRKRVAELEGVIRELKNKPHPRWVQSGSSPGEQFDKWHSRAQSRPASEDSHSGNRSQSSVSSPRSTEPPQEGNESTNCSVDSSASNPQQSSLATLATSYPSSVLPQLSSDNSTHSSSYPSFFSRSSPLSTPSPSTMTPTDEFSRSQVMIAGEQSLPRDFDLASIFMSYPGLMGCDGGVFGHVDPMKDNQIEDMCSKQQHNHSLDGHCGCLNESSGYSVVLELSLRLRKAADVLSRSANHRMGSGCLLNQRIAELDGLATTTLGNIALPPSDFGPLPSHTRPSVNPSANLLHPTASFTSNNCRSTISPQSLHGLRSWDIMSSVSDSPSACDDSFMSWEPSRRPQ
ncbi:hypothetical protein SERLA73DRAFT_72658 [Serpula lacrymans var. lacrymans S7.3]|uniref:Uncharacterized protein n=2 Tax=Serpula lacrymans var. lacrymans TaxID=341189 RepID=F8PW17_SERL3|nr:uncharacterized protein SERLADRAFT_437190 [Serpula lacrymans var. lacrymans S7.9]EGN99876.1 hypothetical protein SERLA73DRAFT_72658 [Serpula lacrymans var. lacrymans S7.3]EGO25444.1 hypothetical protein SERLADRAFT_437190 [Serpula lacrymans var. lacrymans S7.9]